MVYLIVDVVCCFAIAGLSGIWIGLIIWICTREDGNCGMSRRHPILLPHIASVESNRELETSDQTIHI